MILPLWLSDSLEFPDPKTALQFGLVALGGDLSCERLLKAYSMGIFPWYGEDDPIMWWSPDPRTVLFPEEFHLSRSLLRRLRKHDYAIRVDSAFAEVIDICARIPRDGENGTWIVPEMMDAYIKLHREGHAHSVEVWLNPNAAENILANELYPLRAADANGSVLIGGCYGVQTGSVFCGESMFSLARDASKIALAALSYLGRGSIRAIDCQFLTPHLASLGAKEISRARYLALLSPASPTDSADCWRGKEALFADPAWPEALARSVPAQDSSGI